MDYRGRVVVVTGASSGIGRTTARAFARRGATVVGVARREALLQSLIEECAADSPESWYLAGDLAERAFSESVVHEVVRRSGRLDVLVLNAAVSKHKHITRTTAAESEFVMRANFMSVMWSSLAAIEHMRANGGGHIVNVSSFAALVTPPREAVYAASKAAMHAFAEGLRLDLEGSGVEVSTVTPGPIDTEIWEKEDEEPAFDGHKFPPEIVTRAIFDAIEKGVRERIVPRWSPPLIAARLLRYFAPTLLRRAMSLHEPQG